ncbi:MULTISPECIES: M20/M25/M40 family metallo-hydrolase [unclassified Brevundimonas]|uniref:M20/M25/M40 family metallo-hydrolase n=1 Tax=unclassified Brevundimonas TaxID=2622653 RepID=UPI0006FDE9CE|nr:MULTISPECIES: M20/M25/M40 family metallo-hydrolase [unclassified Brevundimonas]KQY79311.1 peptidase M20 [Brevundimonas sp. Root1423]KRA26591.1 peptidase M20 [Brevundimonas sp. Root608]
MRLFLAVLLLFVLPAAAEAQPGRAERTMMQTVTQEHDRHIALLERMVNQNSGTLNLAGVRAVGDMVRTELEPLGFDVRWVDMAETGRAGHLIATHPGRGRNILLIGHLDTVFEADNPFQRFERQGARATGPGIGDDKGGVVVIIAALRAMRAAGTLRNANITLVLTGDEERIGAPASVARRDLVEAGKAAAFALEFENLAVENEQDFGTIARRSSSNWTLTTSGRTGHSSGVFNDTLGYGAIYEMARILDGFRRELPEPNLTYNVGVIAGGTPAAIDAEGFNVTASGKTNIVASTAIARGDLRTLTAEQDARIRAGMQAIVDAHLPRTGAELVFGEGGYPPMAPSEGNIALLARLNAVNRDLGLPEMAAYDPARRGAADSGFVAADVDTLGGLGVAGGNAHADGEWVDLDSLVRQSQRAAVLISRLSLGRP